MQGKELEPGKPGHTSFYRGGKDRIGTEVRICWGVRGGGAAKKSTLKGICQFIRTELPFSLNNKNNSRAYKPLHFPTLFICS